MSTRRYLIKKILLVLITLIAVLATALGIVLALPIGFAAARNLMPPWVSWRAEIAAVLSVRVKR